MKPIDVDVLYTLISKYEIEVTEEKINTMEDEGAFLLNSIRLNEIKRFKHMVDIVPILDVEPVKHGKWIYVNGEFSQCSLCKYPVHTSWGETNYCPNCGAKM